MAVTALATDSTALQLAKSPRSPCSGTQDAADVEEESWLWWLRRHQVTKWKIPSQQAVQFQLAIALHNFQGLLATCVGNCAAVKHLAVFHKAEHTPSRPHFTVVWQQHWLLTNSAVSLRAAVIQTQTRNATAVTSQETLVSGTTSVIFCIPTKYIC